MIRRCLLAAVLFSTAIGASAGRAEFPAGASAREIMAGDVTLEVHVYKPANYDGRHLIMVFHGVGRNADAYSDHAKVLGDRHGAMVVAPLFDKARFPRAAYQGAGIKKGEVPEDSAGPLAVKLVDAVRHEEGRPGMAYLMIGHSAGAQFLSRFAAFVPNEAKRIVIANPSAYVAPTREQDLPYGFGGVSGAMGSDEQIRRYLALPITIFLGTADTGDKNLDKSRHANMQGANRRERGLNVFRMTEALSRAKGWAFGWQLVEVPGVGHNSEKMFASDLSTKALFPN